ncbi:hypothetical protein [Croceicoccus gelatinilyticus]|uniref:hypothetical protein n=1 Tax=Croceicoccus gelatinilyticus TaxID=2835536 RepID=UPI001BCE65DF|nr:hypothetical protein [Croceicoccus gelatinilyticus]MBS7668933.1 hypothetical protein [Croceicoccus gelatinilyticus]
MRRTVILSALLVAGIAVPALSASVAKVGRSGQEKPERKGQPRAIDIAPMLPDRAQEGIGKAVGAIDKGRPDSNG